MERKRFVWDVVLQKNDGQLIETTFASYWSPVREFVTSELIAKSAAAIATVFSPAEDAFVGVSATLQSA